MAASAEAAMTYDECLAWAEKYAATPFNMLALSTAAAKDPGPMQVMRSLFAIAAVQRDALAWIQEFAEKMTDRHTGFVHVERRARAAVVSGAPPEDGGIS
jgi:hypothetical protein